MRKIHLAILILLGINLVSLAQRRDDSDPRIAKVKDAAGAESTVKGLRINGSKVIGKFRFTQTPPFPIVVTTKDIDYAILLRSITSIEEVGQNSWTVKYRSNDGDLTLTGKLADDELEGESDFGGFTLPATKLKRLEFQDSGVFKKTAAAESTFDGVIVLNDGASIPVTNLSRHAAYWISGCDTNYIPCKPYSNSHDGHFTDFTFRYGETKQTIQFDKIKKVEFSPANNVVVTTKSGATAEMKLVQEKTLAVTGFTGTCAKGVFYIPLKFVKSISFGKE